MGEVDDLYILNSGKHEEAQEKMRRSIWIFALIVFASALIAGLTLK